MGMGGTGPVPPPGSGTVPTGSGSGTVPTGSGSGPAPTGSGSGPVTLLPPTGSGSGSGSRLNYNTKVALTHRAHESYGYATLINDTTVDLTELFYDGAGP